MKPFLKVNSTVIDSHCHLNIIKNDVDLVIQNAVENGVKFMLTICTEVADVEPIREIVTKHDNVFCSFGIHPHDTEKDQLSVEQIIEYAKSTNAIAIGETGLDYFYEHSDRKVQITSFKNHIIAASKLDLPLIIHTRNAEQDTMDILNDMSKDYNFKSIFHCFSSSIELAKYAIENNIFLSASGILTFNKSENVRECFRDVPKELLLVETDSPFLAPMPYRGKECEPVMTNNTLQVLADLHHTDIETMAQTTTNNFKTLFKLDIK